MSHFSVAHLSDVSLKHELVTFAARDRATTAGLLARIAEFDARKLYRPAGYPSMYAYCVGELHMSGDAAGRRIQAARAARRFPAILAALADGRLHLTAVGLLAPHLAEGTAEELLAAATHKTKAEIEFLLATRFPRPDILAWVASIPTTAQHALAHVGGDPHPARDPVVAAPQHALAHVQRDSHPAPSLVETLPQHALAHVGEQLQTPSPRARVGEPARVMPLGPQSFGIQFTLSKNGHERLCYAQQLLGHQVPAGDLAAVFERALDALVHRLEKQKFAATSKPRPHVVRASANPRHIPAHVKRAVWQRDQGQCTFVSETGHRCLARGGLEFDHIQEVARGGQASISGIRLRCRAHNQYEAERTFGAEFMRHKRIAAAEAGRNERIQDAAACLRRLGFRAEEIRRAEELWGDPNTPLEEMIRSALKFLCPKARYGTSRAAAG